MRLPAPRESEESHTTDHTYGAIGSEDATVSQEVGPCLAESDTGSRCPIVAWLFGPHRGVWE